MNRATLTNGLMKATVCLAIAMLLSACAQQTKETFVKSGIAGGANVPTWVGGRVQLGDDPDSVYFVGVGVGCDVFDEKNALDQARNHVLQQIGQMVWSRVYAGFSESDRYGFKCGKYSPTMYGVANVTTDALAGDMVQRDTYWEQWALQDSQVRGVSGANRLSKYKVWTLYAVPRARLEQLVVDTRNMMELAAGEGTLIHVYSAGSPRPSTADTMRVGGRAQVRTARPAMDIGMCGGGVPLRSDIAQHGF